MLVLKCFVVAALASKVVQVGRPLHQVRWQVVVVVQEPHRSHAPRHSHIGLHPVVVLLIDGPAICPVGCWLLHPSVLVGLLELAASVRSQRHHGVVRETPVLLLCQNGATLNVHQDHMTKTLPRSKLLSSWCLFLWEFAIANRHSFGQEGGLSGWWWLFCAGVLCEVLGWC